MPAGHAQHLGLADGARAELMQDLLAVSPDAVEAQKQVRQARPGSISKAGGEAASMNLFGYDFKGVE